MGNSAWESSYTLISSFIYLSIQHWGSTLSGLIKGTKIIDPWSLCSKSAQSCRDETWIAAMITQEARDTHLQRNANGLFWRTTHLDYFQSKGWWQCHGKLRLPFQGSSTLICPGEWGCRWGGTLRKKKLSPALWSEIKFKWGAIVSCLEWWGPGIG